VSDVSDVPTLRVEGVSVHRGGRPVVRDVTLDVPPGAVTALLGPNGAGKSTLVLTVAGIVRPTSGRVLLGEHDLTRRPPERIRRAGVAVVPEGRRVLPQLSIADNLRVATYGLAGDDAEQQMVVLAQALVSRPAVLLVDELSLGLAPVVVKRLVPTLAAVAASGTGVLLIEQFAHVALGLADRAYVLEGGRIRYHGPADELRADPDLLHSAYLLRV
jgi:branched-chain amino acid transport system ATP-binding protein